MKTIVLITGGFDPLHSGHIAYFKAAKELGDILVVGVNSDAWLTRKKGSPFMPYKERAEIVRNIIGVDFVINFDDSDNSAKRAIWMVRQSYPQDKIIFANGGDRTDANIPEMDIDDSNVHFAFGVGGFNKANSSSWILQEWKAPKTERDWGYYRVLHEDGSTLKVKELTVNPKQKLSMQRHNYRNEHWFVSEGTATVYTLDSETFEPKLQSIILKNNTIYIDVNGWHQLANEYDTPLKVIEIQYGENCVEEDIVRRENI
jgi:D-beta-D-heptose 7-phosphate kinase/D-beta-D-heptose 1-phosphate adenosyltransferase